jgi:quinol monooxygenase YgiN
MDRRSFLAAGALVMVTGGVDAEPGTAGDEAMFGIIGRVVATDGGAQRLAGILIEGSRGLEGCLSYIVSYDAQEPGVLWVTEVWESEAAHRASLETPQVRAAIAEGRPLIREFGERVLTTPVGGEGLDVG